MIWRVLGWMAALAIVAAAAGGLVLLGDVLRGSYGAT